jgi:hypothetical protein
MFIYFAGSLPAFELSFWNQPRVLALAVVPDLMLVRVAMRV